MDLLKKQGLTLYFLPPYSPELNRIEILWRKVKHEWMEFKTRDAKTLEADLDEIFHKFGEHYQLRNLCKTAFFRRSMLVTN